MHSHDRERINGREVARRAGVSPATVSLVVNGSPLVKDATRKRVQDVIDSLGYQVHAAAAALRSAHANTLGYVLPELFDPGIDVFRHQMLAAVTTNAKAAGYHVLLDTFLRASDHLSLFSSGRLDGAIIEFSTSEEIVQSLTRQHVPFVLVGREAEQREVSWVKADEYGGAYEVTRHLLTLGHRKIALLSAGESDAGQSIAAERLRGFQQALAEANVTLDPAWMVWGDWRYSSGFALGKHLLGLQPRPTAIFVLSEVMAVGVINAAQELGLRIPQDLSVVTTEDTPWVEYVRPQLTAVHIPMYDVGTRATKLLIEQIEHPDSPPQHIVLPARLVIRESSTVASVHP